MSCHPCDDDDCQKCHHAWPTVSALTAERDSLAKLNEMLCKANDELWLENAQLKARVESLEVARERACAVYREDQDCIDGLRAEVERLWKMGTDDTAIAALHEKLAMERINNLRAALRRWGQHGASCSSEFSDRPCSCGLDAALGDDER